MAPAAAAAPRPARATPPPANWPRAPLRYRGGFGARGWPLLATAPRRSAAGGMSAQQLRPSAAPAGAQRPATASTRRPAPDSRRPQQTTCSLQGSFGDPGSGATGPALPSNHDPRPDGHQPMTQWGRWLLACTRPAVAEPACQLARRGWQPPGTEPSAQWSAVPGAWCGRPRTRRRPRRGARRYQFGEAAGQHSRQCLVTLRAAWIRPPGAMPVAGSAPRQRPQRNESTRTLTCFPPLSVAPPLPLAHSRPPVRQRRTQGLRPCLRAGGHAQPPARTRPPRPRV